MAETGERTRVLLKPHPKEGMALHAEQTVQNLLDNPANIPDILHDSDIAIDEHFNSSVSGRYKRAGWRRSIGGAAIAHLVAQNAMPNIIETYRIYHTTFPPNLQLDDFGNPASFDSAQKEAYRMPYWLKRGGSELLHAMSSSAHPYHKLGLHWQQAHIEFYDAFEPWKEGPGKNRWPNVAVYDPKVHLFDSLVLNSNLAISLLSAKAIHHLIHIDRQASPDELYDAALQSIDRATWLATLNRHHSWTPDWRHYLAERGYTNSEPYDGMEALLHSPASMVLEPNGYAASINGVPMMQDPDFCPHEMIRNGPVESAALCPGNVYYRPDEEQQATARIFFSKMDLDPKNGECYNLAGVTLAMGANALKMIVLPAFEAHRREEILAEPSAGQ